MKKIIPVLTLMVGVGIGWGIAAYQSRCALQEIQQTWTPEFREIVTQSVAIGKTMTEDERREMLESAVEVANKQVSDFNSKSFWQAHHALLMKKWIESRKTDDALSYSESTLTRFVEQYDRGDFKDDINEEQAGRLAEAIKSANQSTHSITVTNARFFD